MAATRLLCCVLLAFAWAQVAVGQEAGSLVETVLLDISEADDLDLSLGSEVVAHSHEISTASVCAACVNRWPKACRLTCLNRVLSASVKYSANAHYH